MRTQTSQKVELFAHALSTVVLGVFAVFMFALLISILRPSTTVAATSSTINFQARLETATGAIVADGNYNVEFKLYNASSSSGSSQGSCTGDANCLWTETRTSANQVRVANGYLTVNLGSVTAFPGTINWNQQLWLGMNIGGTAVSPSWDGEMSPRLLLTATPYAFQAGTLSTTNGANVATLNFTTPTATDSILLPDASGTVCLQNASACGFAPSTGGTGYVQLQASSPGTQQTGNFNISGIGIANNLEAAASIQAPLVDTLTASALGIGTTNATSINLNQNTVVAANKSFTANGADVFKDATNSTTAFQIQNASSSSLFGADTSNMRVGVDVSYVLMTVPSGLAASPASGGSLSAGTYKYEVTAIDSAGGETTVSNEATGTTSGGNLTLSLAWTASAGASGYKVYRTAAGGGAGTEKYLVTVLTNSYSDIGNIALGTASAPSSNSAYTSTNVTNKSLEFSVGGNGTPTGQFYVSGNIPASSLNAVSPTNNPLAVYMQAGYAYVISYNSGLFVYDINNPAAPVKVGNLSNGNISGACTHNALYVQGRYAYVTNCLTNTLSVIDISNPSSPSSAGNVSTGSTPFGIYVQGRYAYVTNNGSNTMTVYDISNPASPVSVGSVSTGASSGPIGIYVQGRYAYVTNNTGNTLSVIDISNPSSPSNLINFATGSGTAPIAVYVQGRYAYVVDSNDNAFHVYDISNPANPVSVGSASGIGVLPTSVYIQGRYAYVGYSTSNFVGVYDISNPANPVSLGSMAATGNVTSVFAKGGYVYAIDDNNSFLDVFDVGGEYAQQLQAGGLETGTLQANSNATIGGDAAVQGGLQVGSSAALGGSLGVNGSSFFQGAVGIASGIQGGATVNGISTPGAPTVAPTGTTGSTSYSYEIVAVSAAGGTTPASTAGSTTTGNGTLTTSNYNALSWSPITGATSYNIYRTASAGTPSSTGLIGSTGATSFNDTGIAGTTAAPNIDTSGLLTLNGALKFSGTTALTFTTPLGNSKTTKIAIPLYDPGSFTGILTFGLPASAGASSRALQLYDGRTTANEPTLAIVSPDENEALGLGWNGTNNNAYLETTGSDSNPNIVLSSNTNTIATFSVGASTIVGALTLSGSSQVNYTTPQGSTIPTKINIPNFNPGNFAQIVAMGLPSTAPTSARVITFFDQRASTHQPSIDLFSPDENQYGGLSWDGANTTLYFKSSQGIALSTGDANTNTHNAIAIDASQDVTATSSATTATAFTANYNNLTSGSGLSISSVQGSSASLFTGNLINDSYSKTYAGTTGTESGNMLNVSRNLTMNSTGNTLTLNGALVSLSDNETQTAGTLTDTANVLSVSQGYASASGAALNVSNAGTGSGVNISNGTGSALAAISTTTNGTGSQFTFNSLTSGTGLLVTSSSAITGALSSFNANTLTTGSVVAIHLDGVTTGNGINLSSASSSLTSGILESVSHAATYTTTTTDSGNLLNLNRNLTINGSAQTLSISGALGSITSNCTVTQGTCTDTSNLLSLAQNYASASGTVLTVSNSGSGTGLNVTNGTGSALTLTSTTSTGTGSSLTVNSLTSGTGLLVQSSGAITGKLVSLQGNSLTTGTLLNLSATSLTTGSALNIALGSNVTNANVVNLSGATITGTNGNDSSLLNLNFTAANTVGASSSVNGLRVHTTLNSSASSGNLTSRGIWVQETDSGCNGATCTMNGVDIAQDWASGNVSNGIYILGSNNTDSTATVNAIQLAQNAAAASAVNNQLLVNMYGTTTGGTSYGIHVVPPNANVSAGTQYGIRFDNATTGAATRNAISIGTNWGSQISGTGFSVSGTGATTVDPTTNTTTAFQVQNAGAASTVLSVDTTNLRVNIGVGSTGETTPSLLVLDSKTGSSSDPTEVDGAMYFNTTLGEFRCGVSGSWENCIGGLMTSNTSASSAISNCSTACAAFSKTATLPANYCVAGRVIHITASGVYTNTSGSNATLNIWGMYVGSNSTTRGSDTLIGGQSAASVNITTGTTGQWTMEFNIICDTTGTSGTVTGSGYLVLTEPAEYLMAMVNTTSPFTSTVNTTTSQTIYLFPGFGSANTNTTATLTQLIVTGM